MNQSSLIQKVKSGDLKVNVWGTAPSFAERFKVIDVLGY